MMDKSENWFRTTRFSEAQNALKMTQEFLAQALIEKYYFKWAIIAAHNALQCFMVLALQGTSDLGILKKLPANKEKKFITEVLEEKEKNEFTPDLWPDYQYKILTDPDRKLQYFMRLFEDIQKKEYMSGGINSKVFVSNTEMDEQIMLLNDIRNGFIHYLPSSSAYQEELLVTTIESALTVIYFLLNVSQNFAYHYEEEDVLAMNMAIYESQKLIKKFLNG